jgi:hypothetical protein
LTHQHGQRLDAWNRQNDVLTVVDVRVVLHFVERRNAIPFQATNRYIMFNK